jgi:adenylate cyclase
MARPNGQRRLAAILAMDVVGYSALIERDEAGTLKRLRTLRVEVITPILTSHGGRVAKLMGDGAIVDGVNIAARLEQLAEPGGICLSEAVVRGVRSGLPVAEKDLGPQRLKNIAEPVRAYRLLVDRPAVQPKPSLPLRRVLVAALSALVLLAAIGGAGWWWRVGSRSDSAAQTTAGQPALPLPDRPSIAVLPFDNLSGDERISRLADGMVEDIITDLSRFRELFVIARNSTFVYKGKAVDMRQVGRELGVRYVLDGSVQSTDDRLRLRAQLVDTTSGVQVWSERYDRPLDDLFAVQSGRTTLSHPPRMS